MRSSHKRKGTPLLALGAIGVVFGDIGTSPLYALKTTLAVAGGSAANEAHVLGALSLVVWALILIIGIKYIAFIMKADNGGEGGILALLSIASAGEPGEFRKRGGFIFWMALIGATLLYGDGIITPAISVLSAMSGLVPVEAKTQPHWIVVASAFIVIGVFLIQRVGSGMLGWMLGPLMLCWFLIIGYFGFVAIMDSPMVLRALSPAWGLARIGESPWMVFLMLGGVVLCVTGGEALYADMGHFGLRAITLAWCVVVCPSLLLAYFGQGAAVLQHPEAAANPFFAIVHPSMLVPMVVIATMAAIIASQAIISGVFSMTRQLIQHELLPPMRVVHTSEVEGQVYLPGVNVLMAVACVLMVLLFRSSDALASAYGLAVTGVMVVTTTLFGVVARTRWKWSWWYLAPLLVIILSIELLLLASNVLKIPTGGWVPLAVALFLVMLIAIWRKGLRLINRSRLEGGLPIDRFVESLSPDVAERRPGTGVFFGRDSEVTPSTIRKLQRHVSVLPETILFVRLLPLAVPHVPHQHRLRVEDRGAGVWSLSIRYGYMQPADVPGMLRDAAGRGVPVVPTELTYWVRRDQVALANEHRGMGGWSVAIFAYMLRNATVMPDLLDLPSRRTVEIGMRSQV